MCGGLAVRTTGGPPSRAPSPFLLEGEGAAELTGHLLLFETGSQHPLPTQRPEREQHCGGRPQIPRAGGGGWCR